jgi:phosphopentomutase
MTQKSVVLIVLDGLGVGQAPDAEKFGDIGANTLKNVTNDGSLAIPSLKKFGLYNLLDFSIDSLSSWGKMTPQSFGKSTVEGHWEMMGKIKNEPFAVFPEGFPAELLDAFSERIGRGYIFGRAGSGTELLDQFGQLHMETGKPIVYTSADSVFQIAAHEDIIPVGELYQICQVARELVTPYDIARVIARPFIGSPGNFVRTSRRKDYVVPVPEENTLSILKSNDIPISAVGRVEDLFGEYAQFCYQTINNLEALDYVKMCRQEHHGLVFANLEDFDTFFGHRRDPEGFAESLCILDTEWTRMTMSMGNNDLLLVVSDHGNDPMFAGHTDHTREYTLLLACMKGYKGVNMGIRNMVDVGATILDYFDIKPTVGQSFLSLVRSEKKSVKN